MPGYAWGDQCSELYDVRGGELEGVKVGHDGIVVAVLVVPADAVVDVALPLAQPSEDAVISWATPKS